MNTHFSIINKPQVISTSVFILMNLALSAISVISIFSGGSKVWLVPFIVFTLFVVQGFRMAKSIFSYGIDVSGDTVTFPAGSSQDGTEYSFAVDELYDIILRNEKGKVLDPVRDHLRRAKVIFILKDGREAVFSPGYINCGQFLKLKKGLLKDADKQNSVSLS